MKLMQIKCYKVGATTHPERGVFGMAPSGRSLRTNFADQDNGACIFTFRTRTPINYGTTLLSGAEAPLASSFASLPRRTSSNSEECQPPEGVNSPPCRRPSFRCKIEMGHGTALHLRAARPLRLVVVGGEGRKTLWPEGSILLTDRRTRQAHGQSEVVSLR